jgi:protein-L-isoaspartate(D-aspartate) O-methyltransferase
MKITLLLCALLATTVSRAPAADPFQARRQAMVERDIKGRGISDQRLLAAMGRVPRHLYVAQELQAQAYDDHPLPIAEGQTISQPYVVALMTETLRLLPSDRVLEIGTGSGYQAAVLAELVREVFTIEIRKPLAETAGQRLRELGYRNVRVRYGDGYYGWEEAAPFDAIIVTAAANHVPPSLLKQLKDGGRLILPLGSTVFSQTLTLLTRTGERFQTEQLGAVAFVPMTGTVRDRP